MLFLRDVVHETKKKSKIIKLIGRVLAKFPHLPETKIFVKTLKISFCRPLYYHGASTFIILKPDQKRLNLFLSDGLPAQSMCKF